MKIRCSCGFKPPKNKRIDTIDHAFEEKHNLILETRNRGRHTTLRCEILKHELPPGGVDEHRENQ